MSTSKTADEGLAGERADAEWWTEMPAVEPYSAALALLTEYGDEALQIAVKCGNGLADLDDIEGAGAWLGVIRAIRQLTSTVPEGPLN